MVYTSSSKKNHKSTILNSKQISDLSIKIGVIFLLVGIFIFILTFYPLVIEELKYQLSQTPIKIPKNSQIKPVDKQFSILIPKIQANTKIIANVDPFDPRQYQWQLTKGVAHAKGSSLPDQKGNVFLFAHSSDNWYNANRYNAVFYLINKLKKDDQIIIYYKNKKYTYKVTDKKLINADQINYLASKSSVGRLTLMTCWPPGTTLKRLIVLAKI